MGGRKARGPARALAAAAALALLAACAVKPPPAPPAPPPELVLRPVDPAALAGWRQDPKQDALAAFRRSCAKIAKRAADADMGMAGRVADWLPACRAAEATPLQPAAAQAFFDRQFVPFLATDNGDADGLFTGYYEPELMGSRTRDTFHQFPIYAAPPEAGKGQLPSRAEIDAGALAGRGLELLWVSNPVDLFFLHIQGSGRVRLEDGTVVRVGYAGQNGHEYRAIGRDLVQEGELTREEVSLQTIRDWLYDHPGRAQEMMERNASYTFFRVLNGDGPIGAQGVALTPGRSLAVDRHFLPLGVPIWLDAEDPGDPAKRLRRLVVAQDTGGAIKGPVRGDVFWGAGFGPEAVAGLMKSPGRYYLLLPRPVAAAIGSPTS